MKKHRINQLNFYNGRTHAIDKKRLTEFETKALLSRFYSGRKMEVATVVEDIGPLAIFYANIQPWAKEIPDIDKKSARVFTIWGEDRETKEILTLLHGYFIVFPFEYGKETIEDYYSLMEAVPYYPYAVVSSFLTIFSEQEQITKLLDRVIEEIQKQWKKIRQNVIETLKKTELWKRYVLSFEKIIHFSFMCSSFDRELIEALRRKNYRMTGILQMFASSTPSYDQAMVSSHLREAQKMLKRADQEDS
ncbi:MAG: hypothetical protein ACFFAJ_12820 [Candidatus Hodarchaeota archaeon]